MKGFWPDAWSKICLYYNFSFSAISDCFSPLTKKDKTRKMAWFNWFPQNYNHEKYKKDNNNTWWTQLVSNFYFPLFCPDVIVTKGRKRKLLYPLARNEKNKTIKEGMFFFPIGMAFPNGHHVKVQDLLI